MKLKIFLFAVFLFAFIPVVKGASLSVGGTTWFCSWQTWYNSWNPYNISNFDSSVKELSMDPSFLYGPVVSLRLTNRMSLSTSFLYGYFKSFRKNYILISPASIPLVPVSDDIRAKRYDSDTAFSYFFTKYLKIFAGLKYSHYRYAVHKDTVTPIITIVTEEDKTFNEIAPAIGIGFTWRIVDNLFFVFNNSVMVNFVLFKSDGKNIMISGPNMFYLPHKSDRLLYKIGTNSVLSLAYLVKKINTTFALGFRYQMYKTFDPDESSSQNFGSRRFDHFFGVTATVMYRFDFLKKKKAVQ